MIYPNPDKLDAMDSKYALVIVAAKRARQVKEGARRFVGSRSTNPLTVALEEIAEDQIIPLQVAEPEAIADPEPETDVFGGILSLGDDEESDGTTDDLARLLAADDDDEVEAFEADAEVEDDILQTEDDVMEAEIDEAAEEGPDEIVMPGDESLDAGANDTAQDAEDIMMDDAEAE
jgi:DNA-directed RNA polymerase subunit omega